MTLNNGTKWGLAGGLVIGIVIIFAAGIDDPGSQGSTVFIGVIAGAVIGTVFGMLGSGKR